MRLIIFGISPTLGTGPPPVISNDIVQIFNGKGVTVRSFSNGATLKHFERSDTSHPTAPVTQHRAPAVIGSVTRRKAGKDSIFNKIAEDVRKIKDRKSEDEYDQLFKNYSILDGVSVSVESVYRDGELTHFKITNKKSDPQGSCYISAVFLGVDDALGVEDYKEIFRNWGDSFYRNACGVTHDGPASLEHQCLDGGRVFMEFKGERESLNRICSTSHEFCSKLKEKLKTLIPERFSEPYADSQFRFGEYIVVTDPGMSGCSAEYIIRKFISGSKPRAFKSRTKRELLALWTEKYKDPCVSWPETESSEAKSSGAKSSGAKSSGAKSSGAKSSGAKSSRAKAASIKELIVRKGHDGWTNCHYVMGGRVPNATSLFARLKIKNSVFKDSKMACLKALWNSNQIFTDTSVQAAIKKGGQELLAKDFSHSPNHLKIEIPDCTGCFQTLNVGTHWIHNSLKSYLQSHRSFISHVGQGKIKFKINRNSTPKGLNVTVQCPGGSVRVIECKDSDGFYGSTKIAKLRTFKNWMIPKFVTVVFGPNCKPKHSQNRSAIKTCLELKRNYILAQGLIEEDDNRRPK